jgi:ribose ABC transporter, permease protein
METLKKGLTMMSIAAEWQFVVTGIVLLLAVVIDNLRRIRENAA